MSISEFVVQAQGLQISGWTSSGRGMPVLMLHGSGASKKVFSRQFDSSLAEAYQLVAIDLPGHGASQDAHDPELSYCVHGLASIVDEVIEQLTLDRPAIYGWSLGGHIAIQLAAERNDLAGLALSGTPPIGPGPIAALRGFHARWDVLLASKEVFSDRDADRFLRLCYGDSGTDGFLKDIKRADGRLRKYFLPSLMRGDCADQKRFVETTDLTIAMINGAEDPIIRHNYIEHLSYAALWRGKCQEISGAAHAPFWQQPQQFNSMMHRFLKDLAFDRLAAKPRRAPEILPVAGGSILP
jgi:pimeloyl-ACP methyl ester carboxylesterase